jgi:hypothetical protein
MRQHVSIGVIVTALAMAFGLFPVRASADPSTRITFWRRLPAAHDLGDARRIAVVYALGDSEQLRTFVDVFVEQSTRSAVFDEVQDLSIAEQHLFGPGTAGSVFRRLRGQYPADVYLGFNHFTCAQGEKSAAGVERDVDGAKTPVTRRWIETRCAVRVELIDGKSGKRRDSFHIFGDGSSPPSDSLSEESYARSAQNAARHTALNATESIAPGKVRETIDLDDSAPEYEAASLRISAADFEGARRILESQISTHGDSAALAFDLGALSEALNDRSSARRYYDAAERLAPKNAQFRSQIRSFRHWASAANHQ